jgi:hypothetical protein
VKNGRKNIYLRLGAVVLREDVVEPLANLFAGPNEGFADRLAELFPGLSAEEVREAEKLKVLGGAGVNGVLFRAWYPVENPHLDGLLRFLGRVAEPGQAIVAEELRLNPWGVDHRLRGWKVLEDGSFRPLQAGLKDSQTGEFWPV